MGTVKTRSRKKKTGKVKPERGEESGLSRSSNREGSVNAYLQPLTILKERDRQFSDEVGEGRNDLGGRLTA